jgi:TonB family protein
MQRALLFSILLAASYLAAGQTSETKYYRNWPSSDEAPEKNAKYSRTITQDKGVVTTTLKNLKTNQVESQEAWKGDEPVGVWVGKTGAGFEKLDFDFELAYRTKDCANPDGLPSDSKLFQHNMALSYMAPKIDYKKPEFAAFFGHTLRYPAKARRAGIQGDVWLVFNVTAEGKIEDIVVEKGVDIGLDKEAVRVLRALKLSTPPMIHGKAISVCMKIPVRFKLA